MKGAIIFDLDGVLVDACNWHRKAFIDAFHWAMDIKISNKEHNQKYNGLPTKEKIRRIFKEKNIDDVEGWIDLISEEKQKNTIKLINKNCTKNKDLIKQLKKLSKNYFICCYTNSIRETTNLMLDKTGIKQFFDLVLTNESVTYCKPDPEGYNNIINNFIPKSIALDKIIIFEDSDKGFEAASKSYCKKVIRVKDSKDTLKKLKDL